LMDSVGKLTAREGKKGINRPPPVCETTAGCRIRSPRAAASEG
jgi:hypothetical protein